MDHYYKFYSSDHPGVKIRQIKHLHVKDGLQHSENAVKRGCNLTDMPEAKEAAKHCWDKYFVIFKLIYVELLTTEMVIYHVVADRQVAKYIKNEVWF